MVAELDTDLFEGGLDKIRRFAVSFSLMRDEIVRRLDLSVDSVLR